MNLLTMIIIYLIDIIIKIVIIYHLLIKPIEKQLIIMEEKIDELKKDKDQK